MFVYLFILINYSTRVVYTWDTVSCSIAPQITEIKPLDLRLKFGSGMHGRVHITEVELSEKFDVEIKH